MICLSMSLMVFVVGMVAASVDVDENLKLVLIGMRHADRNPAQFLPDDPNKGKWGLEGEAQLNDIGKRQAVAIGKMLRDRYPFIAEKFHKDEVKGYSSSAERCQQTLQGVLTELYQPVKVFGGNTVPQTVPYTIDNPLLRMYDVSCPEGDAAWQPIYDDNLPGLRTMIRNNRALIDHIEANTGWNGSLSNVADVADNLKTMKFLNLEMPSWITQHNLFPQGSLFDRITEFSEAHQLACANYEPCRDMMAGYWLHDVIEKLKKKKAGDLKQSLVLYASHFEIVLSMMKLLNIDKEILETSSGFIIEYRDLPSSSVRFLTHDPLHHDPDKRKLAQAKLTQECGYGDWCPLDNFISIVQHKAFKDWENECGIEDKECPPGSTDLKDKIILDCKKMKDNHHDCPTWASHGYCEKDDASVKYLLCRKSCLCN